MTSFQCLYCYFWTDITHCSDVFTSGFEQVNACWVTGLLQGNYWFTRLLSLKKVLPCGLLSSSFVNLFNINIPIYRNQSFDLLNKTIDWFLYGGAFVVNPFDATGLFLYPLKTSENQRFSDLLRGYRKRPVVWNGLMGS